MILTYLARRAGRDAASDELTWATTTLFERAVPVMPGGVNSPVRSFRSVGGTPYFVARGRGRRTCGTSRAARYLDYVQSYGASILGHAHPGGRSRPSATPPLDGTTYGAPTEREVLLAEALVRPGARPRDGAAGVERAPRRR